MERESKNIGGYISEVKQENRNGVPVGLISGYIATWDIDRGEDQFVKGAFAKSIAEHKKRGRQVRFKDNHGRTVGGFPIEGVYEDDKGLFGTAEVNLEVQQGREAHSLARQKVLTDFSVGFSALDIDLENNLRTIKEAVLWEGSITDEPMNIKAEIVDVKTAGKSEYKLEDIKKLSKKELEDILKDSGIFSRKACKLIVSGFVSQCDADSGQCDAVNPVVEELKKLKQTLTKL